MDWQSNQPVNVVVNINNGPAAEPATRRQRRKAMLRRRRRMLRAMRAQRQGHGQGRRGHGKYGRRHGHYEHGERQAQRFGQGRTMKITTPQGYVIELSPEEAEKLFPGLVRGMRQQLAGMEGVAATPVSERRLLRRVLKRHRVPPAQRALYKALYEAGDEGLDFTTLAATIGRSTEELSGVLGGLGRRVNATPGIETLPEPPGVNLLFEHKESAPPLGGWGWAMRPELRAVLDDLGAPWMADEGEIGEA